MKSKPEEELHIVTEVGTFGSLNIKDPSKRKIKKDEDLEEVIRQSIEDNKNNLSK